jgi:hypothetical protein
VFTEHTHIHQNIHHDLQFQNFPETQSEKATKEMMIVIYDALMLLINRRYIGEEDSHTLMF